MTTEADTPPATSETKPTHAPPHNESCASGGPCAVLKVRKTVFYVQTTDGGIPSDPELFEAEATARARFGECVAKRGIEFPAEDVSTQYAGNDDDEVRWGEVPVYADMADFDKEFGPSDLTGEQRAEAGRVAGFIEGVEAGVREARAAREARAGAP